MFLAFGFGRIYATREIKMWRHRIDPRVYPNIRFIRERRSYRTISTDFFPVFNSWLTSLWVLTCATVPRLRNILLWKALLFRLSAKRIRKQVWLANGCARCCVQGKLKGGGGRGRQENRNLWKCLVIPGRFESGKFVGKCCEITQDPRETDPEATLSKLSPIRWIQGTRNVSVVLSVPVEENSPRRQRSHHGRWLERVLGYLGATSK